MFIKADRRPLTTRRTSRRWRRRRRALVAASHRQHAAQVTVAAVIALSVGGGIIIGRASMVRVIAEHDRAFNANVRKLAFRIARAAHPKQKAPN